MAKDKEDKTFEECKLAAEKALLNAIKQKAENKPEESFQAASAMLNLENAVNIRELTIRAMKIPLPLGAGASGKPVIPGTSDSAMANLMNAGKDERKNK